MNIYRRYIAGGIVCSIRTKCTCKRGKVGELQLAGGIGQYLLNKNQASWIMPYPQNGLLESIVQHICIGLFVDICV